MKKLLLLSLALSLTVCAFSQTRARLSNTLKDQSVQRVYAPCTDESSSIFTQPTNPTVNRALAADETQLGTTKYDNQTNNNLSNRFYRYADGKMAFVWTMGLETTSGSWTDRGSGYNYFDGTAWGPEPTVRVENARTGWPSYAPLGANGEIIVCHDANNLHISTRPEKGSGTWTQTSKIGPAGTKLTWPRVMTSGTDHNTIHLFSNSYNAYEGQTQALLYSRSQDGGATWDIDYEIIPGTGADSYTEISADDYVWAEPVGNTLAFLCSSKWSDLFLMKSTDNGETWTKTVIWEHPYPMWDWNVTITTDTVWCPESATLALDNTGKAHVAFGIGRIAHTAVGTTFNFWPYTDGIGYWNEDMPPFTNENQHKALCTSPGYLVENVNLIGWMQDMNGDGTITLIDPPYSYNPQIGMSTMPTIAVDGQNHVIVAYSSLMENLDNTVFNYKHIWARASPDGGATWNDFLDVTGSALHSYDECILPLLAANQEGDNIHLIYNADDTPGLTLSTPPDHDPQENRQNYALLAKAELGLVSTSFAVTASASPADGGTVSGAGSYSSGALATMTAVPNTNYRFTNWTENGEVVSTDATYTFTVTGNRTLVANFLFNEGIEEQQFNISILPNPTSGMLKIQSSQIIDKVMVYNSLGVNVKNMQLNETDCKIDLSNQLKGIYYLQISINDKLITRKIVVK